MAISGQLNKVWKQCSFVASALAQFVTDTTDSDTNDDGDVGALADRLARAIGIAGGGGVAMPEPPLGTLIYGRRMTTAPTGEWVAVPDEAPSDGVLRGRQNGEWVGPLVTTNDMTTQMAAYLRLSGGTMTGAPLILARHPQLDMEAATKLYVTTAIADAAGPSGGIPDVSSIPAGILYARVSGSPNTWTNIAGTYLPLTGGTLQNPGRLDVHDQMGTYGANAAISVGARDAPTGNLTQNRWILVNRPDSVASQNKNLCFDYGSFTHMVEFYGGADGYSQIKVNARGTTNWTQIDLNVPAIAGQKSATNWYFGANSSWCGIAVPNDKGPIGIGFDRLNDYIKIWDSKGDKWRTWSWGLEVFEELRATKSVTAGSNGFHTAGRSWLTGGLDIRGNNYFRDGQTRMYSVGSNSPLHIEATNGNTAGIDYDSLGSRLWRLGALPNTKFELWNVSDNQWCWAAEAGGNLNARWNVNAGWDLTCAAGIIVGTNATGTKPSLINEGGHMRIHGNGTISNTMYIRGQLHVDPGNGTWMDSLNVNDIHARNGNNIVMHKTLTVYAYSGGQDALWIHGGCELLWGDMRCNDRNNNGGGSVWSKNSMVNHDQWTGIARYGANNVGDRPTDYRYSCGVGGQAWYQVAAYNFHNSSDERLKQDIEPEPPGALTKVMALHPVQFHWRHSYLQEGGEKPLERAVEDATDEPLHHGFTAQEVRQVMGDKFGGWLEQNGVQMVDYNQLVAVLWQGVQELTNRVAELERRM